MIAVPKETYTMKINRYFAILYIILITSTVLPAQNIPIGSWRDELPYNQCISVTEAENMIYTATPYAIFYVDKEDNSVQRMTKIGGLSDIGITSICYNIEEQTIVLTYANANIDLIRGNNVVNISDIKRKQILGNKTINSIYCLGKYAYLACGFGIVVLDLEKDEISDTYYIGKNGSPVNVLAITSDQNDTIYAATESGLYLASLADQDLANFNSWKKDPRIDSTARYNTITTLGNKVFVNKSLSGFNQDTLFYHQNGQWTKWVQEISNTISKMQGSNGRLAVAYNYFARVYNEDLTMVEQIYDYFPGTPTALDAVVDKDQNLWIGDNYAGLVMYDLTEKFFRGYNLSGPLTAKAFSMTSKGNDLFIAPGGRDLSYVPLYQQSQIYRFDNSNWANYSGSLIYEMYSWHDVVAIAVDPFDSRHFFVATWGSGVLEFNDITLVNRHTFSNSTLGHHSASDTSDIRAGGIAFDQNGNLWVSTSHTNQCLSMRKDGQWIGFNLPQVQENDLGQMIIDRNNQKWIVMRYGNINPYSIIVFSENGTPTNTGDDLVKKISAAAGNGNLPGNNVYAMAEDKDGEIWVGTEKGVAVFYSPESVFSGQNFDAQKILVEQGGYYQYLLENEIVTAIAVDGANRKWIGTDRGGVFLFSEDGTQEIYHFTEDNSPLFSNRITSISINDVTGEVFFGTDKGIISFKSTATEGGDEASDVYAYPNPVKSGYSGYIAIKGLVQNASVKITDISGILIYSTVAEGGQAIWDGKNFDGKRAQTGVYLVFASDENGKEKVVTKILFVN